MGLARRALLAGALLPAAAAAQRPARIGVLLPYAESDRVVQARFAAFTEALARLGWVEGRNAEFSVRWAGERLDSIRAAAAELAAWPVDLIVATGARVVRILQEATNGIPVVFVATSSDPVGQGLVQSLSHPGRNTTGFSLWDGGTPVVEKELDLLADMLPGLHRVTLMFNPENPASTSQVRGLQAAGASKSLAIDQVPVRTADEIEAVIAGAATAPPLTSALLVTSDLALLGQRALIVAALARHRLPAMFADEAFVEIGGLAAYAVDRRDLFRRAAGYVDRILRGERAGDLPVQMPTRYAFTINLATARALGLDPPPTLLARAEAVIE